MQGRFVLVAQSCPTVCYPIDCSPPGSSVHGILQARILEWVTMPSSRGSSLPIATEWTPVSCIAGRLFTIWATRKGCNAGVVGSVHGLGRSPGGGHGNPLQYSCLENPMDRGACCATVCRVTKSQTRPSNWAHTRPDSMLHPLNGPFRSKPTFPTWWVRWSTMSSE